LRGEHLKAAVLHAPYDIRIEELPRPTLPKGHVLVKVIAVGICGTDLAMYRGNLAPRKLPLVPGHEFSGLVERVGEGVDPSMEGTRVVAEINVTCGKCWFCKHGLRTHCLFRKAIGIDLDGAMAEYVLVPVSNLHVLPEGISFEEAVLVEPLAAVVRMAQLVDIPIGSTVVILGSGPIGLLSLQVVKLRGATQVVAIDLLEERLQVARELGADITLNLSEESDPVSRILEITDNKGADVVVEATGDPKALDLALKMVRPRGVIAAKSTHGLPTTFNYTELVVKEISLVGSRCGPFEHAISLISKGLVNVNKLITHIMPLDEVARAFDLSLKKVGIKVVLKP